MKLIIDIPEEVKKKIDENLNACDLDIYDCVMISVKNGIPLEDIKAEIGELQDNPYITDNEYELVRGILKIIDKYKESEE